MLDRVAVLGRGLACTWAAFWLFFFTVESLAWPTPPGVIAAWVGVGVAFVAVAALACYSERIGAPALVAVGVLAATAYLALSPPNLTVVVRLVTAMTLGVPPVLAGLMLGRHARGGIHLHRHA